MAGDKPDPRPAIVVTTRETTLEIVIVVPLWCLDNQSHALTHDQLKHLTGRELMTAMRARREQLERASNE